MMDVHAGRGRFDAVQDYVLPALPVRLSYLVNTKGSRIGRFASRLLTKQQRSGSPGET
jgi:hypothetical protein